MSEPAWVPRSRGIVVRSGGDTVAPEVLERLGAMGVAALPPARLREAADEAWEWGVATADARYCVVWRSLDMIDRWFDDYGALSARFVERLSAVIQRELPAVLVANAEIGCALAASLHEQLLAEMSLAGDALEPLYEHIDAEDDEPTV